MATELFGEFARLAVSTTNENGWYPVTMRNPNVGELRQSLDALRLRNPPCGSTSCHMPGRLSCKGCGLVKYCGKGCQKSDWKHHKHFCKHHVLTQPAWEQSQSAEMRSRGNTFCYEHIRFPTFPWDNTPAVDIINLPANEGENYDKPLHICFAASGDLRNLFQTITSLPHSHTAKLDVILNDRDPAVSIRNAMILYIIQYCTASEAAVIVPHLWYSARLPKSIVYAIVRIVRPPVQARCHNPPPRSSPNDRFEAITMNDSGSFQLAVSLRLKVWQDFLDLLKFDLDADVARQMKETPYSTQKSIDARVYPWLASNPFQRIADNHFAEHGTLTPFATDLSEFTIPNPTLFNKDSHTWHDSSGVVPLSGWPVEDVMASGREIGVAPNDIYGALAYHIQKQVVKFHAALCMRPTSISMSNVDVRRLPLCSPIQYDRLDLSNLFDPRWVGGPMELLSPLAQSLKPRFSHPHACIVGTHLSLFTDALQARGGLTDSESEKIFKRVLPILDPDNVFNHDQPESNDNPIVCKIGILGSHFNDFESVVEPVIEAFAESTKKTCGLELKVKNTVMPKYPWRLPQEGPVSLEQLETMTMWRVFGGARFVEWKRRNTVGERKKKKN